VVKTSEEVRKRRREKKEGHDRESAESQMSSEGSKDHQLPLRGFFRSPTWVSV